VLLKQETEVRILLDMGPDPTIFVKSEAKASIAESSDPMIVYEPLVWMQNVPKPSEHKPCGVDEIIPEAITKPRGAVGLHFLVCFA
jgi:hypothetical protein